MDRYLNRKSFVTTLGVAGLGLGGIAAGASAPLGLAQEASTPTLAQDEATLAEAEVRERFRSGEMREELYAEFTAALADELGIGNADDVDAGIRVAMMTVVDARVDEGLLTVGQAEALKTLIATSDAPLGPGPMFGPHPGAFVRGGHGPGHGGMVPGQDGDHAPFFPPEDGPLADGGERGELPADDAGEDRSPVDGEDDTTSS